ncbi:MAG: efflux RND transporter periplasmic adaptor subunit, partial [Planctomycetes bacterium]|nr:efflux RND transporter periplasmic adaptor subunit [Planctomycetota bacterium]
MSTESSRRGLSRRVRNRLLLLSVALVATPAVVSALQSEEPAAEVEVVIKREAIHLTDPRTYYASMSLQASKSVDFVAPSDGIVRTVTARPGMKLKNQGDAFRLDDTRTAIIVKRARAQVQAAQAEKKLAQVKGDPDVTAIAEARLEAAQAEAELAQFDAEQMIVRAPFNGDVLRVNVSEGQYVRAGEKLGVLVDPSKLWVEVPVERANAAVGSTVDIKIEETAVKAKVEAVTALADKFDALRELTVSPASAVVSIDNAGGKFSAGQTVYSDLIPRTPVALVATTSVANAAEGERKIKVLRDHVIRDVTVRILAKVGTDSVYVSGRFQDGDEIVVYSSRELVDGTPLRALAGGAGPTGKNKSAA